MRFLNSAAVFMLAGLAGLTGCGGGPPRSGQERATGSKTVPAATVPSAEANPSPAATDLSAEANVSPALRPRRIISCAPNLTEMLFALGAGDRLIGVTRFCRYPPEAQKIAPLGDLFSPNLEALVHARPDLIVVVPSNRKIQDFFATHPGPRIFEARNACETIAEIEKTCLDLGRVVGDSARARQVVAGMEAGLDSLRRAWTGAHPVRYLMVLGHDQGALEQIYVVGHPTYLTELAGMVGGVNVVEEKLGRYPIVTREAILAMNPELILERFLGDRPATAEEKRALIALWNTMPSLEAVRTGRIVVMDDNHITINGPDLVASGRKISALLHPEKL